VGGTTLFPAVWRKWRWIPEYLAEIRVHGIVSVSTEQVLKIKAKGAEYMKQESELERLEHFVNSLIARYNDLQKVSERLAQDVQERDGIIEELRENVAQLESERTEIGNRVSGIIFQIEEWEKSGAASAGQAATADNPEGRIQGNLFSIGSESQGAVEND
jgi:DNA repair exonuclease SbcCD ATPase subunit